jgi:hypothetical protein
MVAKYIHGAIKSLGERRFGGTYKNCMETALY